MKPLWESLARSADSSAQKPALIQEGLTLTYAELLDATAAMVALLRREGLRPADTVAIQVPHSVDCVVSLLASMRLGTTVLVLDTSLKQQAVARSCAQAGAGLLLTGPDGEGAPLEGGPRRLVVPPVQGLRGAARRSADLQDLRAGSDAAAGSDFLLLSSGTTGPPKLVHRLAGTMEAAARIHAARFRYGPGDKTLAMLPFCHSFGLGNVLLGTLTYGGTMVLAPFSPRQTAATVERERITVLPATPFMFHMLADTAFHRRPDFSSVRLAAAVGSALSPAIAARFKEGFGVGISESYGATETGPVALAGPELSAVAGCLGKPYPGIEVQIWDASGGRLGPGEPGEIVVKSPAAACEYLGDPEASAGKFRHGYVLTGDSGRLDEAGNLFVTGRMKPMVNVAGKKVAPAEVEACLRSHRGVAETLVVAGSGGEGAEWVKALVVPLGDVTAAELREHCAARLAAFKVPREVVFVESLASGLMHKPGGAPPEPA
jgi:long-chain acyl-CoA synthetase